MGFNQLVYMTETLTTILEKNNKSKRLGNRCSLHLAKFDKENGAVGVAD